MATGTIPKNMVLLWENPNPTVSFAEQTISLDLSEYGLVIISGLFTSSSPWICATIAASPSIRHFRLATTDNQNVPLSREGDILANGIKFLGGYYQGTNNAMMIPYQIFGIKA